ncbi:unnamed protein product [marine sediment metagenome]|uniref:ParB/Sulfiredoxin domain-containing protein n=1 Tax=marine sediment metagenome TaxID=412755 RepID=X0Z9N3_9ZZZZ
MNKKQICEKFGGKLTNGSCKINGFNMDIEGGRGQIVFGFRPNTQQFKIMPPKEFLNLVPKDPFRENVERKERLKKIIKQQKSPVDPLWLDVNVDTCEVLRHEGRGRATASKELGLKKVPVVIFNREIEDNEEFPTTRKNKCKRFISQRSK